MTKNAASRTKKAASKAKKTASSKTAAAPSAKRAAKKSRESTEAATSADPRAVFVFVGPSIAPEEVAKIVPHAEIRRPIRRGDLVSIPDESVVAIIDGVFDAELSVSPREIRAALARGVRIVGSSSMGALRASEVPDMIGVGRVHQMYREGRIVRDDEVAILLDNDTGRALTEPLVNVRHAVERLVSAGTLASENGERILAAATDLHFHDRTYRNIIRRAGLAGSKDADFLVQSLKSFDLKREDAMSLLERLGDLAVDAHWSTARGNEESDTRPDGFDQVRIRTEEPADAPLMIWECGETIDFRMLVRFLALTGRLDEYARRAICRFVLSDGSVEHPKTPVRGAVRSAQDLLDTLWDDWGWQIGEEVHVTLRDLGIGMEDVNEHFRSEHEARLRLTGLYEQMPDPLLRALRTELLSNDIGLKREAIRLGAIAVLGSGEDAPATPQEILEAKRALLGSAIRVFRADTWEELLERGGLTEEASRDVVELVARARRKGLPMLEAFENGPRAEGATGKGIAVLPVGHYLPGSVRSVSEKEGIEITRLLSKAIGITRVAQLSELERIGGLHVAAAYRPSQWSSTVGSGKSEHIEGAIAGAIMEEVEKYSQERFTCEDEPAKAFAEMDSGRAVSALDFPLPFDSAYRDDKPIEWSWATDLVSGERIAVPKTMLVSHRIPHDPLFSQRMAGRIFTTNGLAAGFTVSEALVHALSELVERHAVKLAEQEGRNPGRLPHGPAWPFPFVDLETCPPSTKRIVQALDESGYRVRVAIITSDIGVPTTWASIFREPEPPRLYDESMVSPGYCANPNPEIAVNRAILEAVQCLIQNVSGAREDLTVQARSLGRHERPRTQTLGELYWTHPWVPMRPFDQLGGFVGKSAREDVTYLVERITAAGYPRVLFRDLSSSEIAPAAVVRTLVPGLEDINPLFTGRRARVHAVRDLLRRHRW